MLTDQPLQQILQKLEMSGRLTRWSLELSEFDLKSRPRTVIKGQVLADVVAEFTKSEKEIKGLGDEDSDNSQRIS